MNRINKRRRRFRRDGREYISGTVLRAPGGSWRSNERAIDVACAVTARRTRQHFNPMHSPTDHARGSSMRAKPMRRPILLLAALPLALAATPHPATAQSQASTGVIRGVVLDVAAAPVAGATVEITHRATGLVTTVRTTPTGTFVRPLLPLGTYDIVARAPDQIAGAAATGLVLRVGEELTLTLQFQAIELEGITIEAERAHLVRPEDITSSTRLSEEVVDGLPNNGRKLPRLRAPHPRGRDLAGPRRRRAQHQRPAGHLQQLHRRRRRLQQPLLRRAAGRPAARLHLQPGRHRRGRGGEPGGHGRVRKVGGRVL